MPFVLDASVTIAWLLDEDTAYASLSLLERMADEGAIVASVWPLEISNALCMSEVHRRITSSECLNFATEVEAMLITVDETSLNRALGVISALASEYRLTVYDASYLELAIRADLPLATIDGPLRQAALRAGVQLLH